MLTDTRCRTAKPQKKPYKLTDANRLYLEVKPSGVKTWRYRFELRNADIAKESTFALGDYSTNSSAAQSLCILYGCSACSEFL